ncbi:MAG: hypothetical protein ACOC2L_05355, partial [Candidatus Sumerlaeota bacterium]
MKRYWILLFCASLLSIAAAVDSKDSDTKKILWLGSSSTYFHNMPDQVAKVLTKKTGTEYKSHLVGRGGTLINVYLAPTFVESNHYGLKKDKSETVLDHIAGGDYDYAVLQVGTVSLSPASPDNNTKGNRGFGREHLDIYCEVLKKAGTTPIFYEQGWEQGGKSEASDAGQAVLFQAAVDNGGRIAPCRTAWKRAWKERPELELNDLPDRTHPGRLGLYLNMCCFYAAITGESPV